MMIKEAQVLYDTRGRRTHVVLPYRKYEELLSYLEDASDIKAIEEVKNEKAIPWEKAKKILAKRRR